MKKLIIISLLFFILLLNLNCLDNDNDLKQQYACALTLLNERGFDIYIKKNNNIKKYFENVIMPCCPYSCERVRKFQYILNEFLYFNYKYIYINDNSIYYSNDNEKFYLITYLLSDENGIPFKSKRGEGASRPHICPLLYPLENNNININDYDKINIKDYIYSLNLENNFFDKEKCYNRFLIYNNTFRNFSYHR